MSAKKYVTALYGRTSKDDTRKVTIEIQQRLLRDWAQHDTLVENVVDEFWDDGITGKLPLWERPQGKRLMQAIDKGQIESVAVAYADRFGRTLLDGLQAVKALEQKGVKLIAVNDGWDARRDDSPLYFQFRMMMAEEEHRRIASRMEGGKLRAMERDNAPPGGPLVFGYRMDQNGQYTPDPVEAPIVVRVFEMALEGFSNSEILKWVKTKEVAAGHKWQKRLPGSNPTIGSNDLLAQWHATKIGKILRNRVYIGERKWKDRVFPCIPLVPLDVFERVQLLNERRTRLRGKHRNPEHGLLSGLLVCDTCGARFYHKPHGYRRKDGTFVGYSLYFCNNTRKHWGVCKAKTLRVDELDGRLWELVESYLENPESVVREVINADQEKRGQVAELDEQETTLVKDLQNIDTEVTKIWEMQRAQKLPLDWVAPQLSELNAQRERAIRTLAQVRQIKSTMHVDAEETNAVKEALATIKTRLHSGLTPAEKCDIVRLMVAGGTVRTVGSGPQKRAEVKINLKWGQNSSPALDAPYPEVPEEW